MRKVIVVAYVSGTEAREDTLRVCSMMNQDVIRFTHTDPLEGTKEVLQFAGYEVAPENVALLSFEFGSVAMVKLPESANRHIVRFHDLSEDAQDTVRKVFEAFRAP